MDADRTPDRRRWQFSIASLMVLQALTCIVMSIFTTFDLVTIFAVSLFVFPLGLTVLVARNMQKAGDLFSNVGWRGFFLFATPVGILLFLLLIVKLFFR